MFFSVCDRMTDIKLSRFQKTKIADIPVNPPGLLPDAERLSRFEFLTACLMRGELPGQVLSQYDKLAYQLRQPDDSQESDFGKNSFIQPYAQNFVTHMSELEQFGDLTSENLSVDLLSLLFHITDEYQQLAGFSCLDLVRHGIKPGKLFTDDISKIPSELIQRIQEFAAVTNRFIQYTGASVLTVDDLEDYVVTEKYLLTQDCLYYYRSMSVNPRVNHVTHMLLLMHFGKSINASWVRDKIGFWNPVKGFAYELSLLGLSKDEWDDVNADWDTWLDSWSD